MKNNVPVSSWNAYNNDDDKATKLAKLVQDTTTNYPLKKIKDTCIEPSS